MGLHKFIASDSTVLSDTISLYAEALSQVEGGKSEQYWTLLPPTIVVPKAVADVVEASFASIVVDTAFDEVMVGKMFSCICLPFYDTFCRYDSLKVVEMHRVVNFIFATLRQRITHRGVRMVQITSNLTTILRAIEDAEEEEPVVEALLTELWVELRIAEEVVAKVVSLPRSAVHLQRAVKIVREIEAVKEALAGGAGEEEGSGLVEKLDKLQYLTWQLTKTVGWKSVFQSVTLQEEEREVYSLAQLRRLILPNEVEE
ncbi:hypothetical protein [Sporisorium scitamineum]|nr:hypothetical protein [Sporisorium scitamineum]